MSEAIRIVSATEDPAPAAAPVGYVEAMTEAAALGWVWRPGQADHLRVELQLDGRTVATAVADAHRDDLARGGIGDGNHAFTLPIPPELASRRAEMRVVAVPDGGPPVLLTSPGVPAVDQLGQIQRSTELLVGSQRLLHRNLQAALLQQGPSTTQLLADVAAAQSKLQETVATVELFAIRLEQALAAREPAVPAARTPKPLSIAIAVSSLALGISLVALARAVLGG